MGISKCPNATSTTTKSIGNHYAPPKKEELPLQDQTTGHYRSIKGLHKRAKARRKADRENNPLKGIIPDQGLSYTPPPPKPKPEKYVAPAASGFSTLPARSSGPPPIPASAGADSMALIGTELTAHTGDVSQVGVDKVASPDADTEPSEDPSFIQQLLYEADNYLRKAQSYLFAGSQKLVNTNDAAFTDI